MRPTLEEQIRVSKMTDEELIKLLMLPSKIEFWLFRHSQFLYSLLYWSWFCIWCGKKHFRFSDKKCQVKYFAQEPK